MKNQEFVGFGKRFVAYFIDAIIVGTITELIFLLMFSSGAMSGMDEETVGQMWIKIDLVLFLLYWTIMESSAKQGTVGKMLFKLKVVDANGERLSVAKAALRSFGRFISSLILGFGYLTILFTKKKQGLHDMIAKTYVVKKS